MGWFFRAFYDSSNLGTASPGGGVGDRWRCSGERPGAGVTVFGHGGTRLSWDGEEGREAKLEAVRANGAGGMGRSGTTVDHQPNTRSGHATPRGSPEQKDKTSGKGHISAQDLIKVAWQTDGSGSANKQNAPRACGGDPPGRTRGWRSEPEPGLRRARPGWPLDGGEGSELLSGLVRLNSNPPSNGGVDDRSCVAFPLALRGLLATAVLLARLDFLSSS